VSTKAAISGKPAPAKSASPKATLVPTTGKPAHNGQCVSVEDIRLTAYQKWEAAGKPNGDGIKFWVEAERELQSAQSQ
jgi:hypothetical protein